ncbi:MAG: cupredoxin family copper-binding protein [Actinomycetota bacterium]|nr:cupredoxin family copper-binding protein [Actinomycetota bacterium]
MTPSLSDVRTRTARRARPAPLRLAALAGIVALSGFLSACGSSSKSSTAPASGGNAVSIKNFSFAPQSLTVKVGTTVTWTNQDSTPHTVQFSDKSIPTSEDLTGGTAKSTYTHTFAAAGTFAYICGIHNYMTGTIKVTP